MLLPPLTSTLFPYTTLFRSQRHGLGGEYTLQRRQVCDCELRKSDRNHGHPDNPRALDGTPRQRCAVNVADRKSTRLNSSHLVISYAVFCLKKKNNPEL